MTSTIVPIVALVLITLVAITGLRRISDRIRLTFDCVCFFGISAYFAWTGMLPIFPPLGTEADVAAFSVRVLGGAWWLFGARLAVAILSSTIYRSRRSREARLFSDLSAGGIYLATGLIVFSSVFALPVAGLVATSGIVAIVLGLALQNTLADVFAGIAVGLEGPFRLGDRIQLNDNLEGVVVQLNWRSVRIHTDGNDVAIIPNSLIAKAEIVNRSFPTERRAASVDVHCPECALPERVVETLLQATLLCPNILETPPPSAVISELGSKKYLYRISFYVAKTDDLATTKDTLLRVSRRQLYYAGLLDRARRDEQARFDNDAKTLASQRLLRDAILFESLDDEQITALTTELQTRRLEPGEVLFAQGVVDKSLYLVTGGVIEVTRLVDDVSERLGFIGAGEYIGEIGLLTGAEHAATATAKTHGLVFSLPHKSLAPLLEQNADLAAAFDKSARKGLDVLHRQIVARAAPEIGAPGQLVTRIRQFFHFGAT
ncbi:mechanosensitive ion channel family protein [Rhizobium mesoamericanum]|uniref:mechanosensitive ion channel family protein n=1 Tax=Rhizobium mesoamericanum TaxID=1079800 RepID=UPI0004231CB6|nr:mechanosensitive ion channel family protein [Rhizobium mesoamericanum]